MMTPIEFMVEAAEEGDYDILLADGFEDAAIGLATRFGGLRCAAYDRRKCIGILMTRDGMTQEDAEEFFEFNVAGAWMGDGTPVFIETPEPDFFDADYPHAAEDSQHLLSLLGQHNALFPARMPNLFPTPAPE